MSFLESITKIAKPVARPAVQLSKDPVIRMRGNFERNIDTQVQKIKSGVDKERWFIKQSDKSYVLSLRNGNKPLTINNTTHFAVKDANAAIKFLEIAKKAAAEGEFDEQLKETAFKRKPKEKQPEVSEVKVNT